MNLHLGARPFTPRSKHFTESAFESYITSFAHSLNNCSHIPSLHPKLHTYHVLVSESGLQSESSPPGCVSC